MARRGLLQEVVHEALVRFTAIRGDRPDPLEKIRVDSEGDGDLRGVACGRAAQGPHPPELLLRKLGDVREIDLTVGDRALFAALAPGARWSSRAAR